MSSGITITAFSPETIYGLETTQFWITGTDYRSDDGKAMLRFTATEGTPFEGGTSATLEHECDIHSYYQIRGTLPPTGVTTSVEATLSVLIAGQGEATLTTPVRFEPQAITGVTPGRLDGSREATFSIQGLNLRPVSGAATVTFVAEGADRFLLGANPAGVSSFSVAATVKSGSEITGSVPFAGVSADVVATVRVMLPSGAVLTTDDTVTFEPGTTGVRGRWTYEVPTCTPDGLDYSLVAERPVRGARVQLVDDETGSVITTRVLDDDGHYEIHYGLHDPVRVRVLAQTGPPAAPIQVQDNTNDDAVWASEGDAVQVLGPWEVHDYVVPLGWDGSGYTSDRASGPFAILDTVYEATARFLQERSITFPTCRLNWSPNNRPEDGDPADGAIGTSHFLPDTNEMYILGQEDVDTDEYDAHVVLHEWGHYFEDNLSRSCSTGGPHYEGDRLDPTVAWSEGYCTALSALLLAPDTTYADTGGIAQSDGFGYDLEDNASDTNNPGWFSESSVEWVVFDLFDSADEAWDTVSLGLGDLYDVMSGPMSASGALTTIFLLVDGLKSAHGGVGSAIDVLCQHHAISPVQDEWGTGEANNGGWSENLPVYHATPVGTTGYALVLDGWFYWNDLYAVRFIRFEGTGSVVTINATTSAPSQYLDDHDIWVDLYEDGEYVGSVDDVWYGTESYVHRTKAGSTYVARIVDLGYLDGTYTCTVDVTD